VVTVILFFLIFYKTKNTVKCQLIVKQRLDKHPAIGARNNRTNVYSSLSGKSQSANGQARYLACDLFSVWSAPCSVLSNRTVNTSTIKGVFYVIRAEGL
jgi:hypothetical protein